MPESVANAGLDLDPDIPYRMGQKRARSQLSCTFCRQAKLKCDRAQPSCDQCLKRTRGSSCTYVSPAVKAKKVQNMRSRIKHLETVIRDLMGSDISASISSQFGESTPAMEEPSGPSSDPVQASNDLNEFTSAHKGASSHTGRIKVSDNETTYTGGSHWATILGDVSP